MKSDNSDLFYALHHVDVKVESVYGAYGITITDIFDFDYDNEYDSLFTSLVNNWAWLCQQGDVLSPINITIKTVDG